MMTYPAGEKRVSATYMEKRIIVLPLTGFMWKQYVKNTIIYDSVLEFPYGFQLEKKFKANTFFGVKCQQEVMGKQHFHHITLNCTIKRIKFGKIKLSSAHHMFHIT